MGLCVFKRLIGLNSTVTLASSIEPSDTITLSGQTGYNGRIGLVRLFDFITSNGLTQLCQLYSINQLTGLIEISRFSG